MANFDDFSNDDIILLKAEIYVALRDNPGEPDAEDIAYELNVPTELVQMLLEEMA